MENTEVVGYICCILFKIQDIFWLFYQILCMSFVIEYFKSKMIKVVEVLKFNKHWKTVTLFL